MPLEVPVVRGSLDRPLWRASVVLRPSVVVVALLLVCAAKGIWMSAGVQVPPDPDTVRDLGFIQGFLDGNWFGDPMTAGAWRWYPPLLHGLAALVVAALGLPLLPVWLHTGAWLNLLSPLLFHLMNRRLIGAWPAAAATVVFVLFTGLAMPGDRDGGVHALDADARAGVAAVLRRRLADRGAGRAGGTDQRGADRRHAWAGVPGAYRAGGAAIGNGCLGWRGGPGVQGAHAALADAGGRCGTGVLDAVPVAPGRGISPAHCQSRSGRVGASGA